MPSTRSGASYKLSSSSQKGHGRDYGSSQSDTEGQGSLKVFHNNKLSNSEPDDTMLPSKRADPATRSLSVNVQSQPDGLQQCTAAQRVPDPCRSVPKQHELTPDYKKVPGSSQHLQVTQWMASIDGKEEYDAFNRRMEQKPTLHHQSKCQDQLQWPEAAIPTWKNIHKRKTRAKGRHRPQSLTARDTGFQRFNRMPWKLYFRWAEP
ncbi:hypothetical protein O181_072760 [Austropuccinia psidii MF-1]|uniref:Uncharacterized protein n=1 Tax=Austropuccinia psidii MF-1 TaxID=1389203 RepID=A0A9Q3F990_9BASI|nr:hypothetical protein [Austropuccinia psidii MF-1]